MKTVACGCDIDILKDAVRIGRANMICPKCKKDISLKYFLVYDATEGMENEEENSSQIQKPAQTVQKRQIKKVKKVVTMLILTSYFIVSI